MTADRPAPPQRRRVDHVDPQRIGARLTELREALAQAARVGGRAAPPEVLVASKYFEPPAISELVAAGATLLGENRAEVIAAKQAAVGTGAARWDFIGELQSRKVKDLVGAVTRIHTLASASAARRLAALEADGAQLPELLVQVNVAGDAGKGGLAPEELPAFLAGDVGGLPVRGLMTMPPLAASPDDSRRWFSTLRELAATNGLTALSMGTSQDALVAAEEGATVVRVGGLLIDDDAWARLFPGG
ncbi:MAG: YggS family pyridoxal phosphate-dependent enzyme [Patulibacter minatonensis]